MLLLWSTLLKWIELYAKIESRASVPNNVFQLSSSFFLINIIVRLSFWTLDDRHCQFQGEWHRRLLYYLYLTLWFKCTFDSMFLFIVFSGRGIYVVAFSYPVVPKGQARVRVQLSAAHTHDDVTRAVNAFAEVAREIGLVKKWFNVLCFKMSYDNFRKKNYCDFISNFRKRNG